MQAVTRTNHDPAHAKPAVLRLLRRTEHNLHSRILGQEVRINGHRLLIHKTEQRYRGINHASKSRNIERRQAQIISARRMQRALKLVHTAVRGTADAIDRSLLRN